MIEFKIRPDKRGKWRRKGGYFMVLIAPSVREVRKIYGRYKNQNQVMAFCRTGKVHRKKGCTCLGWIVLPKNSGITFVSHEATHAALYFLSWQFTGHTYGRPVKYKNDENVCLAVSNIAREIAVGFRREGVWK